MIKEIGLVGYGVFGRFAASILSKYYQLKVFDIQEPTEKLPSNVYFTSLDEVLQQELIVVAIPVQFQEKFFSEIGGKINSQAIVLDVSSVKVRPVELMNRYLPETVQILGTHPLFGPNSGSNGLEGLKIVLCPVRMRPETYTKIKNFLSGELKLEVLDRSPAEHDQYMAFVQALTFFVGKAVSKMGIPDSRMNTQTYKYLLSIKQVVESDTEELFETIQNCNPLAKEVRAEFLEVLRQLNEDLDG